MAKILIVHDYPLVVEGLFHLLCSIEDVHSIRHVGDEGGALQEARILPPDIVLIDVDIASKSKASCNILIELTKICNPEIVILGSMVGDLDAWGKMGVTAVLLKHIKPVEFLSVMKRIVSRVNEGLCKHANVQSKMKENTQDTQFWLTSREQMVLGLMSHGMTSQEMADKLRLSKNTIRYYAQIIIEKLGVRNRIQAVTKAQELGLIDTTDISMQ